MKKTGKKKEEFESPYARHRRGMKRREAMVTTVVTGALLTALYFGFMFVLEEKTGVLIASPFTGAFFIILAPPVMVAFATIFIYKYLRGR